MQICKNCSTRGAIKLYNKLPVCLSHIRSLRRGSSTKVKPHKCKKLQNYGHLKVIVNFITFDDWISIIFSPICMLSLRKLLLDSGQRRPGQSFFDVVSRGQDSKYFMNAKLTAQIFIKNVGLANSKSSKSGNIQLSIRPAACMSYYIF